MLGSGYKGCSAVQLASDILAKAGGLEGLMKMSINEIMSMKGVKLAKATQLLASLELVKRLSYQQMLSADVITNPESLIRWLQATLGLNEQECLVVVFLDARNHVSGYNTVFKGSIDNVHIEPRDIFAQALKQRAAKIIMAHNHPSQNVRPSSADLLVTKNILQLGTLMNIPLLDHIIVAHEDYYSFKENNRL